MSTCIFCKMVAGEITPDKVYEDEQVLAFKDIHPVAPVHVLVIPRQHVASLAALRDADGVWVGHLMHTIGDLARQLGIEDGGYRVVTNHGAHGGQSVDHLHFHLLGGRDLTWPPG